MRRFVKRRRTFKRRKTYKKSRKVARIGTVKRMIHSNEESKWKVVINEPVENAYDNPPNLILFNGLNRGVARDQRNGQQVRMVSLELFVTLTANSTNRAINRIRMLVFIDKQTNQLGPGPTQLFAGVTTTPYNSQTMMTPISPDFWGKRFKLLRDRTMIVGQEGGAVDYAQEKTYRFFIPLKGTRVQYADSDTASVTDIIKNSLHAVCVSDEKVANAPVITFRSVLKWKDS